MNSNSYPYVGDVVHYVSYGTPGGEYRSECRAAVVTEVGDAEPYLVGLCVLNPTGQFFNRGVPADFTENQGGSWHWPEHHVFEPEHSPTSDD